MGTRGRDYRGGLPGPSEEEYKRREWTGGRVWGEDYTTQGKPHKAHAVGRGECRLYANLERDCRDARSRDDGEVADVLEAHGAAAAAGGG